MAIKLQTLRELQGAEYARVVAQRDELLAALKEVTDSLTCQRDYMLNNCADEDYKAVEAARKAIAKAEGQ